jgi:hypothetical protein
MNTVDGIAHILRGRHNHGECEKDETGDTPVEPEHFAGRVKLVAIKFRQMALKFVIIIRLCLCENKRSSALCPVCRLINKNFIGVTGLVP